MSGEPETALDRVYAERDQCVALAAVLAQYLGLRTWIGEHEPKFDPNWEAEWRNVIYIELPTGQVSWHIHEDELPWFRALPSRSLPWDGHDEAEKYDRLRRYVIEIGQSINPNPFFVGGNEGGGV